MPGKVVERKRTTAMLNPENRIIPTDDETNQSPSDEGDLEENLDEDSSEPPTGNAKRFDDEECEEIKDKEIRESPLPSTSLTTGAPDGDKNASSSADEKLLEIDTIIQKRYNIGKRLGKGAYGIVWQATTTDKREHPVAVKKIFDAFRNSTDAQRTYREIVFLKELGCHPNIINLTCIHKAANCMDVYLTFPLMKIDLYHYIKHNFGCDGFPQDFVRNTLFQILKGLKYIHTAEVIHRDLKPANILLDHDNTVKVADFGLARSVANIDQELFAMNPNAALTDYVATRWYRPPEILINSKRYTKAIDMWSIGCILGEMIRGKPLFQGSTTKHQIEIVVGAIEKPPREEIDDLCSSEIKALLIGKGTTYQGMTVQQMFWRFDRDTQDIMQKLLAFHPDNRLTVEQTLDHSYLARYRNEQEEIACQTPVCLGINDNKQLSMKHYRKIVYGMADEEIKKQNSQSSSRSGRPSLIPVMRSASTSKKTCNPSISGKPVSVHTLPKRQTDGEVPDMISAMTGITLSKSSSKENLRATNTRSSIQFSTITSKNQVEQTNSTIRKSRFEPDLPVIVEGPKRKTSTSAPSETLTQRSKRDEYWDENVSGSGESGDAFRVKGSTSVENWEIAKNSPAYTENIAERLWVPLRRTISTAHNSIGRENTSSNTIGRQSTAYNAIGRESTASFDSDSSVPSEGGKRTYQQTKSTKDFRNTHTLKQNTYEPSIPWLANLLIENDPQDIKRKPPRFAKSSTALPVVQPTLNNIPGAGGRNNAEKALGFGSAVNRWDVSTNSTDKKQPRISLPLGKYKSDRGRSAIATNFNGKDKSQIQHELDMSAIRNAWPGERKGHLTKATSSSSYTAYESNPLPPATRYQKHQSSYFPDSKNKTTNQNNKDAARKRSPSNAKCTERRQYDYSQAIEAKELSKLLEVKTIGR